MKDVPYWVLTLFYAVGFGVVGYGLWAAWRSAAVGGWRTTPGTVARCELKTNPVGSDDGPTYQARVSYAYTVNGRNYTGDRVAIGYAADNTWAAHKQIYDRLRAAKSVTVRYDPADPSSSALSYGLHRSIRFLLAFGCTWLLFTLGFTVILWVTTGPDDVLLRNLVTR